MSEKETSIPAAPQAPERDTVVEREPIEAAAPTPEEQATQLVDNHPIPHSDQVEAEMAAQADADEARETATTEAIVAPTEADLNALVDAARGKVDEARAAVAQAESFLQRQSDQLDVAITARQAAHAKEPPQKAITDYIASQNRIRAAKGKRRQELAEAGVLELMGAAAPAKIDSVRRRTTGFGNSPKPTPMLGGR